MPLAVCATPIGNLEDVTLRVLAELRAADVVLCEDTRHTRILFEAHGITSPRTILSYRERNGRTTVCSKARSKGNNQWRHKKLEGVL